jgi:glutamate synthase (ferredoxin)
LSLEIGGIYRWKEQAKHMFNPTTISKLQAVRLNSPESYKEYATMVNQVKPNDN